MQETLHCWATQVQNRKGEVHSGFVISTRQLQMGLVRRCLKPSGVKWSLNGLSKWTSVQMETCLSELLVQTLFLVSGERKPARAYFISSSRWHLSYRRWLCLFSQLIMKESRCPMLRKVSSGNREDIPAHVFLFDPGALLSNAAFFSLTQELRGRSLPTLAMAG